MLKDCELDSANFCGVDLSTVYGLTLSSVKEAVTDASTTLPTYLLRPS